MTKETLVEFHDCDSKPEVKEAKDPLAAALRSSSSHLDIDFKNSRKSSFSCPESRFSRICSETDGISASPYAIQSPTSYALGHHSFHGYSRR